jgi:capsular exopolysaccharide synthesis family protein
VALGLLSSLGLTLLLPKLERGFVSAVDLEKRLGLPVFGAVPMLGMQELAVARRKPSIIDYIVKNPLSRFAESLRDIRTALHIADHSGPRIIQVMSAVPGEGKSTIAAALAISAARAGLRTVLVDADLRYPSVSAMFDLRGKEGLVDILIKGIPLQSALQADREIPLAIVAAGSAVSPQPDIIATQQFSGLLLDLANHYDFVVLDSPPILAVSDALAISRHVDATLLVIEWRTTPKDLVEQAVKLLRTLRAPIAGVAFNKINLLNFDQNQNRDLKYRISIDKYCGAASPEVISGALSSNKPRPPRERPNDTN